MRSIVYKYKVFFISLICIISITTLMGFRAYSNNERSNSSTKTEITQSGNKADKVNKGEEFEVTYTITPKDIQFNVDNSRSKDVVLVVDTSSNMGQDLDDQISKLEAVKKELRSLVKALNINSSTRIGIVNYDKEGRNILNLKSIANTSDIESSINNLKSSTNITGRNSGDGLRLAYYMLESSNANEKYIILVNGDKSNYYSHYKNQLGSYYTSYKANNDKYEVSEDNSNGTGKEYISAISNKISDSNKKIKLLSIAVTGSATVYNENNDAIKVINGNDVDILNYSYKGSTNSELKEGFSSITNMILTNCNMSLRSLMGTLTFTETLPNSINIIGNKLNVKQGETSMDIEYKIKSQGKDGKIIEIDLAYEYLLDFNSYKAKDIVISFKAKGIAKNKVTLGVGSTRLYSNNVAEDIDLIKADIEIYEKEIDDTRVTIFIEDDIGLIKDIYDTNDTSAMEILEGQLYAKASMKTDFGELYNIFGEARINILFNSSKTDCLNYKIINLNDITLEEINNEDIWDNWDDKITKENGNGLTEVTKELLLPDETGIYYILYDARETIVNENGDETSYRISKRGVYGPFIRSDRVKVERIAKYFEDGHSELQYVIQPKPIKFIDIYRSKSIISNNVEQMPLYKEELDILNPKLSDVLPVNITNIEQILIEGDKYRGEISVDSNILIGNIYTYINDTKENKLVYTLDKSSENVEEWEYICDPITIRLNLGSDMNPYEEFIFSDKIGKFEYGDILANDLEGERVNGISYLDGVTYQKEGISEVITQGIFDGDKIQVFSNDEVSVSEEMNYSFATIFEVNSDDSVFKIELPAGTIIDVENTFICEITEQGLDLRTIEKLYTYNVNDKALITNKLNSLQVKLISGKKYAVIYNFQLVELKEDSGVINSSIDRDTDNKIYLKKSKLPDLF